MTKVTDGHVSCSSSVKQAHTIPGAKLYVGNVIAVTALMTAAAGVAALYTVGLQKPEQAGTEQYSRFCPNLGCTRVGDHVPDLQGGN